MNRFNKDIESFDSIKLTLASPEQIKSWSYGEVTKAETINYRTHRPEPDGLFCEKIFGPTKSYECYCGKYRKVRYKGIVCDKCGVEVTVKDVRKERMGHIDLAIPVAHVWYSFGSPSKISTILGISNKSLQSVIYYSRYMVVSVEESKRESMLGRIDSLLQDDENELKSSLDSTIAEVEADYAKKMDDLKEVESDKKTQKAKLERLVREKENHIAELRHELSQMMDEKIAFYERLTKLVNDINVYTLLTDEEYIDLLDKDLIFFEAEMGAGAIEKLFDNFNLDVQINKTKRAIAREKNPERKILGMRRLQYLEGLKRNGIDPKWMIMRTIPVIPPDIRPIVSIPGGKFATNDLNDLYRKIINRNNRLKRLIDIGAPEVILRNERRMLQESVDSLIDNMHSPGKAALTSKKVPYNSLTDTLRGKKGLFRKNLLGKRVDYAGRGVIVGDASLRLHQCGLPKSMALEIYKPFVIHKLLTDEIVPNVKLAREYIDERGKLVWDYLEEVIQTRPVLLNRAPTLHKYGIQAFEPKLIEGDAIRLHPLVCKAFNADFDGDTMAVHVLLTDNAIREAREFMMSTLNIISISDGNIMANPSKDMLLGLYLLTKMDEKKNPKIYPDELSVMIAIDNDSISLSEEIIVRSKKAGVIRTTAGRLILNGSLPETYPYINEIVAGPNVGSILDNVKNKYDRTVLVTLLDTLKDLGFKYATEEAYSFSMKDCDIDFDLKSRIQEQENKDIALQQAYLQGFITHDAMQKKSISEWEVLADRIGAEAWDALPKDNPVYESVSSKANGDKIQARQIFAMKGLVKDSEGKWVPMPIKSNYRQGLDAFEYFVSASGARKGVVDTALRTPDSGYLTRKLVDVAHDVIVRIDDCGYDGDGWELFRKANRKAPFKSRVYGKFLTKDIVVDDKVIFPKDTEITRDIAEQIDTLPIESIWVRSPITCQSPIGICIKCYGHNLETGKLVDIGKPVGIIAAQSIGEPGTQFTLRTFHLGGVQKSDITQGLPRVQELLESRIPKLEASMANFDGKVTVTTLEDGSNNITIIGKKIIRKVYNVSDAIKVNVKDGDVVTFGQILYTDMYEKEIVAVVDGSIKLVGGLLTIEGSVDASETLTVLAGIDLLVNTGDTVKAGQALTIGYLNPKKVAIVAGVEAAQRYVLEEVQRVYVDQGVGLMDVHFEIIVRQMCRYGRVYATGDTSYMHGAIVNRFVAAYRNKDILKNGGNLAYVEPVFMGIRNSAVQSESWLSASSFEQQVKVLTEASLLGSEDPLLGMKESVMIGKLIPVGDRAKLTPEQMAKLVSGIEAESAKVVVANIE